MLIPSFLCDSPVSVIAETQQGVLAFIAVLQGEMAECHHDIVLALTHTDSNEAVFHSLMLVGLLSSLGITGLDTGRFKNNLKEV